MNIEEFKEEFGIGNDRIVARVNVEHGSPSVFIQINYKGHTVLVNPMATSHTDLNIDLFPFKDNDRAEFNVLGMKEGEAHRLEALAMVAVFTR